MAGTEKQGFDNSFLEMLEGAKYIVTAGLQTRELICRLFKIINQPIFLNNEA